MTVRVPRSFRDMIKRRSVNEYRSIQDIVIHAVEQDLKRKQRLTKPEELFETRFMVKLKKSHLSRSDYYDA